MDNRHYRTGLSLQGCPASNAFKGNHERDAYGHCHLCGSGPAIRATPPSPSTAPTEQSQATDLHVMPPFAAPAGQLDSPDRVEAINEVAELYGHLLAEKRNAHAAQGRDRGTEYYIADGIRWAIGELDRRCRAQGGVTNSNPSSTAPTVEVDDRAAFEAWFAANRFGGMKDSMWAAWEGRAALASRPAAQEAPPCGS